MSRLFSFIGLHLLVIVVVGCSGEPVNPQVSNPLKGLADDSGQYERPSRDNTLKFPLDHQPHFSYKHEWWYLTANLETEDGRQFATQWTLFRTANSNRHWYFAHAALADSDTHFSAYRNGRDALGNVAIQGLPFSAEIDDWRWSSTGELLPALLTYGNRGQSAAQQWQAELTLGSVPHFYLQGDEGFSLKHPSQDISSHYYSQPFIDVTGKILWQQEWVNVTGVAWFDREWGSQMLAQDQQGWDWFSLRLDSNTALMVYRIRSEQQDMLYGSLMFKNGDSVIFDESDIQLTNMSTKGNVYPDSFKIVIPSHQIDVKVDVINDDQIMRFGIEYFEGMVNVSGSHDASGFVEMTGY